MNTRLHQRKCLNENNYHEINKLRTKTSPNKFDEINGPKNNLDTVWYFIKF